MASAALRGVLRLQAAGDEGLLQLATLDHGTDRLLHEGRKGLALLQHRLGCLAQLRLHPQGRKRGGFHAAPRALHLRCTMATRMEMVNGLLAFWERPATASELVRMPAVAGDGSSDV